MKPNHYDNYIEDFADELWHLGHFAFMVAWANKNVSQEAASEKIELFQNAAQKLAGKLGTDSKLLENIAIFIAEKYREL